MLVLWADPDLPPTSNAVPPFNLGRALPDSGGTLRLFDAAGRMLAAQSYGQQVADLSIGRAGSGWALLAAPTPGTSNAPAALLDSPTALRFNEWMADPIEGADWFEIVNTTNRPVALAGLYLSADPSLVGRSKWRVPDLSFVGPNGFTRFDADGDAGAGPSHVNRESPRWDK